MPEQHLSAELLQQITGGCKECNRDKIVLNDHLVSADIHRSLAQLARSNEDDDLADFHQDQASSYVGKAIVATVRRLQRQATPGHVIIPEPQLFPGRRWIM
jgi:hypothetical protein